MSVPHMPRSKIPPTGWHFMENGIRLEATLPEELEQVIIDYRRVNGLPPGDPHVELINYICHSFPSHCGNSFVADHPSSGKDTRPTLLSRVSQWTMNLWRRGKLSYVSTAEAQQRAAICRECPRHGSWDHCAECGALIKDTKAMCSHLRGGRAAPDGLMGCHEGGFDCGAAVWLKGITTGTNFPGCWAKV